MSERKVIAFLDPKVVGEKPGHASMAHLGEKLCAMFGVIADDVMITVGVESLVVMDDGRPVTIPSVPISGLSAFTVISTLGHHSATYSAPTLEEFEKLLAICRKPEEPQRHGREFL